MDNKIIAIGGATASGKTALAIKLAKQFDGEVVSFDSMQIYRGMDIGTAKPTLAEREGIPHHMFDICEPSEDFSCAEYSRVARPIIRDILSRGKTPILCGGTGLYLDSIIYDTELSPAASDEGLRRELERYAEENGNEALHSLLREVDPESADAIHMNNVKRVIRAIEIYRLSGKPKSEWDRASRLKAPEFSTEIIVTDSSDRESLYKKIDRRVDIMIESGLEDEVRTLYASGRLVRGTCAAAAIGYKEMLEYIDGRRTLDSAIEEIKLATRRYAKRQITWFSKYNTSGSITLS